MLKRNALLMCLLGATLCCTIGVAACGGSSTTTVPAAEIPAQFAGMPSLAEALDLRSATIASGPPVTGDACTAYAGGALVPGMAMLDSSGPPPGIAWALYLFPEPLTPAYTLGVQAEYIDEDPFSSDPRDGYWLAYGNYDSGAWEFAGPFTTSISRVFIKPGVDVVNTGGQVAVVILCENGNKVNIQYLRIGEDAGYGYEELPLAGPPGSFAGRQCDLQLDPAGNPQVLYSVSPGIMSSSDGTAILRIARLDGGEWGHEDLNLGAIENVRWSQFAIGSGGRRAVLVKEQDLTDDLYLFYDDGTGFLNVGVVTATSMNDSYGGLTFVNKDDIAGGPLDRLLIAYTVQAIDPDVQTQYHTFDGAVLGPPSLLYPLVTRECGRISLSTGPNRNGVAGVPDYDGVDWHCRIGLYTAVTDTWDFLTVPAWTTPTKPEWDPWSLMYLPDFRLLQTAGGEFVAGYIADDEQYIRFGQYDGLTWESTLADQLPVQDSIMDSAMDFGVFTTGQAATLTTFGASSPQLSHGFVGTGDPWFRTYLSHEPWSMLSGSIAVDGSDNVHMAMTDFGSATFEYYRRDAVTQEITKQTIDNGGGDRGNSFAFAHSVLIGEQLHVFYADSANHRIVRSVVENGVWLVENEPLTAGFTDWPYYVMGAGYLENSGLIYVAYMDYLSFSMKMLTGTPWGNDWETHEFATMMIEFAFVTDDETVVGALGYTTSFSSTTVAFVKGDPRAGPHPKEILTMSNDHISMPFHLAYNSFNGQWCVACNDDSDEHVNYFQRTPLGSWIGPFLVAEELGSSADIDTGGIDINRDDGTVRICLERQPDGDPISQIWVYSAPDGSAEFAPTQQLMSIDTTTHDYQGLFSAPTTNGEPMIAVIYNPIADPHAGIRFFQSSAPDTWASIGLWDTQLRDFYPDMEIDADGGIFFSAIEMNSTNFGTLTVRYPW